MRYVFVLTIVFSLDNTATARSLPTATKLLDIRSVPAVHKPANRLLRKLSSYRDKVGIGSNMSMSGWIAWSGGFGLAFGGAVANTPFIEVSGVVMMAGGFPIIALSLGASVVNELRNGNTRKFYYEIKGRRVYYTELRDGKAILHFGQVTGYERHTGMLLVEATEGGNNRPNEVYHKNLGGVSVPNHQDLSRRVKLLSKADSEIDYLYDTGEVSEVYDDGHYEIAVDRKVNFDGRELPIDKPYKVFVHASVQAREGGFVFTDSEKTEHVVGEAAQIISAARQADYAQQEELEQVVSVDVGR